MTRTTDFGADALMKANKIAITFANKGQLTGDAFCRVKVAIHELASMIEAMQPQHEESLAKAAGEWIDCKDELPLDSGDFLTQTAEGEMEKEYFSYLDRRFAVNLQPVRWLKAAPVPAPPPLPEKEIEVPDLVEESCGGWGDDYVNEAHKAAMLPVLKENEALKARIRGMKS